MNGFGFIEYDDPLDARDVVPGKIYTSRLETPGAMHDPFADFFNLAFRTFPTSIRPIMK